MPPGIGYGRKATKPNRKREGYRNKNYVTTDERSAVRSEEERQYKRNGSVMGHANEAEQRIANKGQLSEIPGDIGNRY